jgi:hypothetical protein
MGQIKISLNQPLVWEWVFLPVLANEMKREIYLGVSLLIQRDFFKKLKALAKKTFWPARFPTCSCLDVTLRRWAVPQPLRQKANMVKTLARKAGRAFFLDSITSPSPSYCLGCLSLCCCCCYCCYGRKINSIWTLQCSTLISLAMLYGFWWLPLQFGVHCFWLFMSAILSWGLWPYRRSADRELKPQQPDLRNHSIHPGCAAAAMNWWGQEEEFQAPFPKAEQTGGWH